MTNTGNIIDTFDVAVSGHTWPTTVPVTVGPLERGGRANMDVTVNIPPHAAGGVADTATIIVTSQGDSAQLATAILTTTAESASHDLFLPLVLK